MSPRRLFAIILKELRQLRRDRMTLALMIGIPSLQLILFGYAINLDVRDLPAAVADLANTAGSRALVQDIYATGVIAPHAPSPTPADLMRRLQAGEIHIGIVVPADFERRRAEEREVVQIVVDASDPVIQQSARQLAQIPLAHGQYPGGIRAIVETVSVLPLYNPERRSAINIVPGLIGVILTLTMVLFTAVALVRERERGNLELLIATPVSRLELMTGKVLPYIGIGLIQTSIVLTLGMLLFRVPIRGSVFDAYLAVLLLIAANLSLGLMISTRAQTQFQAMQMTFFVFLPSILLSGFMFPFDGMPAPAQTIAELLPLTHFVRLIRAVMLRGAQLHQLLSDMLALAAFTVIMMTLAVLRFSKRLD